MPGGPAPYGVQPPYGGQPGFPQGFPPPAGGPDSGAGAKIAVIVAGAVALLAIIAGGVYLGVSGGDDKDPVAGPSVSAGPTTDGDSGGSGIGTGPTDDPVGDPTTEPTDDPFGGGGSAPAGDDFRGQWTASGRVLTIGDKFAVGEHAGKFNLNWIETGGGSGICLGFGEMRGHDLKLTVTCNHEDVSATARKTGDGQGVELTWDDGHTDSLEWERSIG
jgi:hypothetical protein